MQLCLHYNREKRIYTIEGPFITFTGKRFWGVPLPRGKGNYSITVYSCMCNLNSDNYILVNRKDKWHLISNKEIIMIGYIFIPDKLK